CEIPPGIRKTVHCFTHTTACDRESKTGSDSGNDSHAPGRRSLVRKAVQVALICGLWRHDRLPGSLLFLRFFVLRCLLLWHWCWCGGYGGLAGGKRGERGRNSLGLLAWNARQPEKCSPCHPIGNQFPKQVRQRSP